MTKSQGLAGRRPPMPLAVAGTLTVAGVLVAVLAPTGAPQGPARAVLDLWAARESGSCADYVATTTPFFRNDPYLGSPTCADVEADAAGYAARGPIEVEVTGVVQVDTDTAEVETVERYRVGSAEEHAIVMAYRTQLVGGAWAVDHADLTVLPD